MFALVREGHRVLAVISTRWQQQVCYFVSIYRLDVIRNLKMYFYLFVYIFMCISNISTQLCRVKVSLFWVSDEAFNILVCRFISSVDCPVWTAFSNQVQFSYKTFLISFIPHINIFNKVILPNKVQSHKLQTFDYLLAY